jgi:hypothetical protein
MFENKNRQVISHFNAIVAASGLYLDRISPFETPSPRKAHLEA